MTEGLQNLTKAILKQLFIFLLYLILCSLLLLNHQGGADILFTGLMFIAILIHFITTVIKVTKERKEKYPNWTLKDLYALVLIAIIFIVLFQKYMEFMWWLTS
jgi:hypothetical protein